MLQSGSFNVTFAVRDTSLLRKTPENLTHIIFPFWKCMRLCYLGMYMTAVKCCFVRHKLYQWCVCAYVCLGIMLERQRGRRRVKGGRVSAWEQEWAMQKRKRNPEDSLQCSFTYRPVGANGMLLDHKSTSGWFMVSDQGFCENYSASPAQGDCYH